MKKFKFILMGMISVSSPFIITYYPHIIPPFILILGLMGMMMFKIISELSRYKFPHYKFILFIVGILALGFFSYFDSQMIVQFYPVIISLCMSGLFGLSLLYPPTIIERIARLQDPNLDAYGIAYTRKVTLLWTLFCFGNAVVSYLTSLHPNPALWAIYNGCISYILMGSLMAAEYIIRRVILQKRKG